MRQLDVDELADRHVLEPREMLECQEPLTVPDE
jgi:hypothetical protein